MPKLTLAIMIAALLITALASPSIANASVEPDEQQAVDARKEADDIIKAAARAGKNAELLAMHIRNGDQSAATKMVGQEINIGGKPTQRTAEAWTMRGPQDILVTATKLEGTHDPNVRLEGDVVSMWGKLKSVDVKARTITLEDVELIYVEWMPALHVGEK